MTDKSAGAFRTIGEVSAELGVPQHVLRYWETRFAQLRPLQRAGNRRYYRPDDVILARRINRLLNQEGYTVRGVQQVLEAEPAVAAISAAPEPAPTIAPSAVDADALRAVRDLLADALAGGRAARWLRVRRRLLVRPGYRGMSPARPDHS